MLSTIYPDSYTNSSAQANVASITFAGTVVGMLFFGYTSDHFSRKWSLFTSTIIIILFAILGTASYGAGGSPSGLLTALVVYRFFLGIGMSIYTINEIHFADYNRHWRRISSRQRRLCRIDGRAQARNTEQVVHSIHKRPNRLGILHQRNRCHGRCPRHGRESSSRCLADLSRNRYHSSSFAALPASQVTRARSIQARIFGQSENSLATHYQVLLVSPQYRQHHLVHLRLQRLLFRYLRDLHPGQFARRICASVEESGVEYSDQFLLYAWLPRWCFCRRSALHGS